MRGSRVVDEGECEDMSRMEVSLCKMKDASALNRAILKFKKIGWVRTKVWVEDKDPDISDFDCAAAFRPHHKKRDCFLLVCASVRMWPLVEYRLVGVLRNHLYRRDGGPVLLAGRTAHIFNIDSFCDMVEREHDNR